MRQWRGVVVRQVVNLHEATASRAIVSYQQHALVRQEFASNDRARKIESLADWLTRLA